MRSDRRAASATTVVLLLVSLGGCALLPQPVVTRLPDDGDIVTPDPSPTSRIEPTPIETNTLDADGTADCAGAPLTVTAGSGIATLVGDCPELRVEGDDLVLDASGAQVGALATGGDRVQVSAAAPESVTVEGNEVTVVARQIGALVVRGDRNGVSASVRIDSVAVSGNGNVVRAESIDSVVVAGSGNTVEG